jgi:hypothetical protein
MSESLIKTNREHRSCEIDLSSISLKKDSLEFNMALAGYGKTIWVSVSNKHKTRGLQLPF